MARFCDLDEAGFAAWVAERPTIVQELAQRFPPNVLYRLRSSGHRVSVVAYSEDGTMTVLVSEKWNLIAFPRQVFGIPPEHLEECDLPGENELVGAALTDPDEIRDFIRRQQEGHH